MNKVQAFHAAVGQFVVAWADLEQGLDFLVLLIARTPGQRLERAPHQLSAKISFIRRRLDVVAHLQEGKTGIVAFLDEVQALGQTRHDLVHGAANQHFGRLSSKVTFTRLLQPPKELRPEATMSISEIVKIADRVSCPRRPGLGFTSELALPLLGSNCPFASTKLGVNSGPRKPPRL
jgi:hypothetical protein